jgi:hypothetical protein
MTQLRRAPEDISNYFDSLFAGVGHRGSSFTDIDGLVHDGKTSRFLFMEFKEPAELTSNGQRTALVSLSRLPSVDVWLLRRLDDGWIQKIVLPTGDEETLSEAKIRLRFEEWWGQVQPRQQVAPALCPHGNASARDCTWCWKEGRA